MTEHTPGPWDYEGPPSNIHVFDAERPHMRICFMTSDGPTEANARLIAAAPDMLKVLKHLYDHGYVTTGDHDMVRNIIAKADGK